jgi:uracil-DNA glycosylase
VRVIVCLGGFAWQALWPVLAERGYRLPRPRPAFGHGVQAQVPGPDGTGSSGSTGFPGSTGLLLLGCYHPSQQNTFTGRLTPQMTDDIFRRARAAAGLG